MILTQVDHDKYQEDGYLIIDTHIPEESLDRIISYLGPIWKAGTLPGVTVMRPNKIQDLWRVNEDAKAIALHERISTILFELYDRKPIAFQTLNFWRGTQQKAHSDTIHFNSKPFGLVCGVWVAFEDIGADQGPLKFYPGSHHLPEMNFEDLDLPVTYDAYPAYEEKIIELIAQKKLQPKLGLIKKGQAIIWAANLLHGGAKQLDMALTRQSQVTHYYFEGAKCWRPGRSGLRTYYFEPREIRPLNSKMEEKSGLGLLWQHLFSKK